MTDLAEALSRVRRMVATDSRDWSRDRSDAWLYGLLCGWDCEDQHEHDDDCGDDGAMRDVAADLGWSGEDVARLRRYRAAIREVSREEQP